jgi:hypothetical protein
MVRSLTGSSPPSEIQLKKKVKCLHTRALLGVGC